MVETAPGSRFLPRPCLLEPLRGAESRALSKQPDQSFHELGGHDDCRNALRRFSRPQQIRKRTATDDRPLPLRGRTGSETRSHTDMLH